MERQASNIDLEERIEPEEPAKTWWHNFVTREDEYREPPSYFSDYVPQVGGRVLYDLYVRYQGMEPIDAACKILAITSGKESIAQKAMWGFSAE